MTQTRWNPRTAGARLAERFGAPPEWAVVLGSGMGPVSEALGVTETVPYGEVGLPSTGVSGHAGSIGIGAVGHTRVAVLSGRVHGYEGHGADAVVAAVRGLAVWGVPRLVLTSAVGSLRTDLHPGTILRVTDHINLMGWNPLTGPNDDELGPRFPDVSQAYDDGLADQVEAAAAAEGVGLRAGVYCGMSGPSYETAAEVRMLGLLGGDVVGMSMVPEAIAALHAGTRVLGLCVVSNLGTGLSPVALDHGDVTRIVGMAAANMKRLLVRLVASA